jgi:hypothetical protein
MSADCKDENGAGRKREKERGNCPDLRHPLTVGIVEPPLREEVAISDIRSPRYFTCAVEPNDASNILRFDVTAGFIDRREGNEILWLPDEDGGGN